MGSIDATVQAAAFFSMSAKKPHRAQHFASSGEAEWRDCRTGQTSRTCGKGGVDEKIESAASRNSG
jgi:hypothetical protein